MTVNEMITSFSQYYDKMTNLAAPGYEDSEILLFLNNAQLDLVKDRMFGENFQEPKFEDNQKRVTDLRSEVTYYEFGTFLDNTVFAKSKRVNFGSHLVTPSVLYVIGVEAQATRSNPVVSAEWANCDFVRHEDMRKFDTTTFNKPFFPKPKYYIDGGSCYLIFDAYTTGYCDSDHNVIVRYIREPIELEVGGNCFFNQSVHQEIVDIAVRQAMQTSQDQRFETKVIEEKNIKTQ